MATAAQLWLPGHAHYGRCHSPVWRADQPAPVKTEIHRSDEDQPERSYAILNAQVHRILKSGDAGNKQSLIQQWLQHPQTHRKANPKAINLAAKLPSAE